MSGLIVLDVAGALLAVLGFQVAFRQQFVHRLVARVRSVPASAIEQDADRLAIEAEREELTSVWRMAGVMLMAFSITGVAFANVIVHSMS